MKKGTSMDITAIATVAVMALLGVAAGYGLRLARPSVQTGGSMEPGARLPKGTPAVDGHRAAGGAKDHAALIAEALAEAGDPPSIDALLATRGFDRYEKLARFLATADAEDCKTIYTKWSYPKSMSHHCMDMILLRWAEVDPDGAMKKNRSAALWAWAKSDPNAALARGLANNNATSVIRAIGQDDPERGLELLRQNPAFATSTSWEGIVTGLGRTDCRAAIELALHTGVDLDGTVSQWVERDSHGALAYALALDDPRQRRRVLTEFFAKLEEKDPERVASLIAELPVGKMREDLRRSLLESFANSDLNRALGIAESIEGSRERSSALRHVAAQIAMSDPDAALEILAMSGSAEDTSIPDGLVSALVSLRPQETLKLCRDHEHGAEMWELAQSAARGWVRDDPEEASVWIAEQPEGAVRDMMVRGLVDGITQYSTDPDYSAAAIWALTLDQRRHSSVLTNVFRQWIQADRPAALEGLQMDGIPARIRQRYIPTESRQ